jgi:hypothetical protein
MSHHATDMVLNEIRNERASQDEKWGGAEHDDEHYADGFEELIENRLTAAHASRNRNDGNYRRRLIQVAALTVAAIERWDRANPMK